MKFNNKKKIILGSIIGILIGTLMSVSYAFFTYSKTSAGNTTLVTGDIYMKYKDDNKEINLSNAMPSTTSAGGDYFEFEITGKNTSNNTIYYELLLNHGTVPNNKTEANRIADEFLRFKLVEVDGTTEGNDLLTTTQYYTIDNERIYVGTIGTTNNYIKKYRLYMWIDNSVGIGTNTDYTQSEWNNLFASIGVNVVGDLTPKTVPTYALITYNANGGVVKPSKKQISTTATIYGLLATPTKDGEVFDGWYTAAENGTKVEPTTSYTNGTSATTLYAKWNEPIINCPGPQCVYRFSEDVKSIGDQLGILGTDYFSSYADVLTHSDIQSSREQNYCLAHILNNDGTIKESYACRIYNDATYCIRGGAGDESSLTEKPIYNANLDILEELYPSCDINAGNSQNLCWGDPGGIAKSIGSVTFGPSGANSFKQCVVTSTGKSACMSNTSILGD